MKISLERLMFWAPRVVCILFALFVILFALDVFGEGGGFWKTTLALLIHLIPTWLILIVLAVSWRWWEWRRHGVSFEGERLPIQEKPAIHKAGKLILLVNS